MKLIPLCIFFLLTVSFTISQGKDDHDNKDDFDITMTNVPKEAPKGSKTLNIGMICKECSSKTACASMLKSLVGDKEDVKPSRFAQKVLRRVQNEFADTTTTARKKMREDDLEVNIKKALSHCVKMYLDMSHELRGLYISMMGKSSDDHSEASKFSQMAKHFPKFCEKGLEKAGTSGKKLEMYKNYKDLEDMASTLDAVIRYSKASKAAKKY